MSLDAQDRGQLRVCMQDNQRTLDFADTFPVMQTEFKGMGTAKGSVLETNLLQDGEVYAVEK